MPINPSHNVSDVSSSNATIINERLDVLSQRLDSLEKLFDDPNIRIVPANSPLARTADVSAGFKSRLADIYDLDPRQAQNFKKFKHAALLKSHPDKVAPGVEGDVKDRATALFHRQEQLFERRVAPNWDAVILTAPKPEPVNVQPKGTSSREKAPASGAPKFRDESRFFVPDQTGAFVEHVYRAATQGQAQRMSSMMDQWADFWQDAVDQAACDFANNFLVEQLLNQCVNHYQQGFNPLQNTWAASDFMAFDLSASAVLRALEGCIFTMEARNPRGFVPLNVAIGLSHEPLIDAFLGRREIDINCFDAFGHAALHVLADTLSPKSTDILAQLLDARPQASINVLDGLGRTPLMHAVLAENIAVIESLLGQPGLDVNARDIHGFTAFDYLRESPRPSMMHQFSPVWVY